MAFFCLVRSCWAELPDVPSASLLNHFRSGELFSCDLLSEILGISRFILHKLALNLYSLHIHLFIHSINVSAFRYIPKRLRNSNGSIEKHLAYRSSNLKKKKKNFLLAVKKAKVVFSCLYHVLMLFSLQEFLTSSWFSYVDPYPFSAEFSPAHACMLPPSSALYTLGFVVLGLVQNATLWSATT